MKMLILCLLSLVLVNNQFCFANGSSKWTVHTSSDIGSHAWITQSGLENISDYYHNYDSYSYLISNQVKLLYYVDKPDHVQNDLMTFQGHFYNPFTRLNWMGKKSPTAFTRFTDHTLEGLKKYKENKHQEAIKSFGYALHYLEDSCVPHHAKNLIAGNSWHTSFESYANKIKKNYRLNNIITFHNWSGNILHDLSNILHECSYKAYSLAILADQSILKPEINYGESVSLPCFEGRIFNSRIPNCNSWKIAAISSLRNAQIAVIQYLHRLIIELEIK